MKKSKLKALANKAATEQRSSINLHKRLLTMQTTINTKRAFNVKQINSTIKTLNEITKKENDILKAKKEVPVTIYHSILKWYKTDKPETHLAVLIADEKEKMNKEIEKFDKKGLLTDEVHTIIKEYYGSRVAPYLNMAAIERFLAKRDLIDAVTVTFKDVVDKAGLSDLIEAETSEETIENITEETVELPSLDSMSYSDLKKLAKDNSIAFAGNIKKADLLNLLNDKLETVEVETVIKK